MNFKINVYIYFFLLLTSFIIFADGNFFKTPNEKINISTQKAIILNNDNKQTIVLQSEFTCDSDSLVWIIPVPSKPSVKIIKEDLFQELDNFISNTSQIENVDENNDDEDEEKTDQIQKPATLLDIAIFPSKENDINSVFLWLNRRNFNIDEEKIKIFEEYIKNKYYFIIVKFHLPEEDRNKYKKFITPFITISFDCNNAFFPLKLYSKNLISGKLIIYLINNIPMKDRGIFNPQPNYQKTFLRFFNKDMSILFETFPQLKENKYYLNKLEDILEPQKNYDDLILDPIILNRNKYIYSLENSNLNISERIRAIKALGDDKDPIIQEKFKKNLKEKNDCLVTHSAIALLKTNYDSTIANILIEQFKKTCRPFYHDCYPEESDKSFIEIINELNIKEAVPILIEILNNAQKNTNKELPIYIIRTLNAMSKLGTNKDAIPGLLYIFEHDVYFYYKPITQAITLLGEVGNEDNIPQLTHMIKQDWGGSTEKEAWPYFGLRDACYEAIFKIKFNKIDNLEKKILYLRELMNESKNLEESYNAAIVLLRLGDRDKAEEVFVNFLKMDDHLYGASKIAMELNLVNSIPSLIELLTLKKGNVPDTVYFALEMLDKIGISHPALIKIIEKNPNAYSQELAKRVLIRNGTNETIELINESNLISSEEKEEMIISIKNQLTN